MEADSNDYINVKVEKELLLFCIVNLEGKLRNEEFKRKQSDKCYLTREKRMPMVVSVTPEQAHEEIVHLSCLMRSRALKLQW